MLKKIKSNAVANKPNRLIQAGQQMLPFQQKVFLAAITRLELKILKDKDLKNLREEELNRIAKTVYYFPVGVLFENFDSLKLSENSDFTKEIEQKVNDLAKQIIKIKEEGSYKAISILDYAEYKYAEKKVYFRFSPSVIPIFLDMFKEGFTKIRLISFVRLRSGYSMRIYEELLRVKNMDSVIKKGHTLTIYELSFLVGIDRNKEYKKWDHFKQRILLPAQKEIKEKTGLSFEFEEIRKGKPVYYIRFYNIVEDQSFIGNAKQISLFEEVEDKDIMEIYPEENPILSILEQMNEMEPTEIIEPTAVIEKPVSSAISNSISVTEKFTKEQLNKLDEYLKGIFSHKEIKEKYDFDYIEFYYNKANEIENFGGPKNNPNFLYNMLTTDKYKYYELKKKEQQKKDEAKVRRKAEEERKEREKKEEEKKKQASEEKYRRLEEVFDSLSDDKKKMYLEKIYAESPFYASIDQGGIKKPTKWKVAEMVKDEETNRQN